MAFGGRIEPDLSTKLPQRAPETAGLRIIYIFRILKGMLLCNGLHRKRTDRKKFFSSLPPQPHHLASDDVVDDIIMFSFNLLFFYLLYGIIVGRKRVIVGLLSTITRLLTAGTRQ